MLRSQAPPGAVAAIASRPSFLSFLYQTRTIFDHACPHGSQSRRMFGTNDAPPSSYDESYNPSWRRPRRRLMEVEKEVDDEVSQRAPTLRKFPSIARNEQRVKDALTNAEGNPVIRTFIGGPRHQYDDTERREQAAEIARDDPASKFLERRKLREKNAYWKKIRTQEEKYPFSETGDEYESVDGLGEYSAVSRSQNRASEDGLDMDDEAELEKDLSVGFAEESTITTAERQAFQRIFSDIMARSKLSGDRVPPLISMGAQEKAVKKPKRAGLSLVADSDTKGDAIRSAVESYPLPLRAAAARALGLAAENATLKAFENQAATQETQDKVDELEHLRQPERDRVEDLMREARTDFELWQIMEQEVFSIVGKLEIEDVSDSPPVTKRRGRPKKIAVEELKKPAADISDVRVPPLALLGPLYPSHLLLGLRLLDRSFGKPSPLVLNILPRIKALGIISHVLGASLALYNELLRIHWTRYDDFPGVLKLLEEMELAGLDMDGDTLDVVLEIRSMQRKVARGEKGLALQALWSLPEYSPQKFADWQAKIQHSREEKSRELAEQSRLEGKWETS